mmetsp:Transcript_51945/g.86373  ORF Transcript_51945/g.86373 Transcript_51945/m.86373 type:complete len:281 (+) Transcript_51945:697-1539(+)
MPSLLSMATLNEKRDQQTDNFVENTDRNREKLWELIDAARSRSFEEFCVAEQLKNGLEQHSKNEMTVIGQQLGNKRAMLLSTLEHQMLTARDAFLEKAMAGFLELRKKSNPNAVFDLLEAISQLHRDNEDRSHLIKIIMSSNSQLHATLQNRVQEVRKAANENIGRATEHIQTCTKALQNSFLTELKQLRSSEEFLLLGSRVPEVEGTCYMSEAFLECGTNGIIESLVLSMQLNSAKYYAQLCQSKRSYVRTTTTDAEEGCSAIEEEQNKRLQTVSAEFK